MDLEWIFREGKVPCLWASGPLKAGFLTLSSPRSSKMAGERAMNGLGFKSRFYEISLMCDLGPVLLNPFGI